MNLKKKKDSSSCCLQETHFRGKHIQNENDGKEKSIPCKCNNNKKRKVPEQLYILLPDNTEFKAKTIIIATS